MILPINRLVLEGKNREKLIEDRGEGIEEYLKTRIHTFSNLNPLSSIRLPVAQLLFYLTDFCGKIKGVLHNKWATLYACNGHYYCLFF
jgi:hypothetical protein